MFLEFVGINRCEHARKSAGRATENRWYFFSVQEISRRTREWQSRLLFCDQMKILQLNKRFYHYRDWQQIPVLGQTFPCWILRNEITDRHGRGGHLSHLSPVTMPSTMPREFSQHLEPFQNAQWQASSWNRITERITEQAEWRVQGNNILCHRTQQRYCEGNKRTPELLSFHWIDSSFKQAICTVEKGSIATKKTFYENQPIKLDSHLIL